MHTDQLLFDALAQGFGMGSLDVVTGSDDHENRCSGNGVL